MSYKLVISTLSLSPSRSDEDGLAKLNVWSWFKDGKSHSEFLLLDWFSFYRANQFLTCAKELIQILCTLSTSLNEMDIGDHFVSAYFYARGLSRSSTRE